VSDTYGKFGTRIVTKKYTYGHCPSNFVQLITAADGASGWIRWRCRRGTL